MVKALIVLVVLGIAIPLGSCATVRLIHDIINVDR